MQKNEEATMTEVVYSVEQDMDIICNNHGARMANIYEDFGNGGKKTTPLGLSQIMKYFKEIPQEQRALSSEYFLAHLESRGLRGE